VHVDGHDHRAEATTPVDGLEELERVRHHHRDAVTPPHSERRQHVRDPAGTIVELRVRAHPVSLTQRDVLGTGSGVGEQPRILVAGL